MHRPADRPPTSPRAAVATVALAALMAWADARPTPERTRDVVASAAVRWGARRSRLVQFEDVVRNDGTTPLRHVRADVLLPVSSARQTVHWVRLSPHAWRITTDAHGERVASASIDALAPGDATTFSWIACVDLAEELHTPDPGVGHAAPPDDVRRYLADSRPFQLTSRAVTAAAEEVRRAAPDGSPLSIVHAAAAYVRRHVDYVREGGWDPAPIVLARGSGSCTESTWAFIAICRRLGVPARWIGGTMERPGPSDRGVDTTFHRMAQAWISGHGWLPIETTRGRARGSSVDRIPAAMLELAVGDGSGDAGAGTSYFARNRWAADETGKASAAGRATCRAIWLPGIDDARTVRDTTGDDLADVPARATILACDARGFGPALDACGSPIPSLVGTTSR